MDAKYINPFLDALKNILSQFGITDIKKGKMEIKEIMHVDKEITSVLGIVGDIRGNVAYSVNTETAKKLVSLMMMGMEVSELDLIGRSAVSEFTNMVTGTASAGFDTQGIALNISPPSVIFGRDVYFIISSVQTIALTMQTEIGEIEINIGLEV